MFVCRHCLPPKNFPNEPDYRSHQLSHKYKCTLCDISFDTHFASVTHYNTEHPTICYKCNKDFDGVGRNYHLRQAHNNHPCDICLRVYSSAKDVKLHTANPETHPFRCNICELDCSSNMDFWYHCFIKHRNHCVFCETSVRKQFSDKLQWQEHLKTAHGLSPCGKCYEVFQNEFEQKCHYEDKHRVHCDKCGSSFPDKTKLIEHTELAHNVVCHICQVKFHSEASLAFHYETHIHKCTICGLDFPTNQQKEQHIEVAHSKNSNALQNQSFPCLECPQIFNTRFELHVHVTAIHDVDCPLCGLPFETPELQRKHFDVFHNMRCEWCNAQFDIFSELRVHCAVVHRKLLESDAEDEDEGGFGCSACAEVFDEQAELVDHYSRRHINECKVCGTDFQFEDYLVKHLRDEHAME